MLLGLLALVLLKSHGRSQAAAAKSRRQQQPDLYSFYRAKLPAITPGAFVFETTLLRAGEKPMILDTAVESIEWRDEGSVLAGTVQLRRPQPLNAASLPIGRGHRIRLRVRWEDRWFELWQMRCLMPDADPQTGSVTCELLDDLDLLRRDQRDWNIRAGKHRPKGMLTHEAARIVLQGIPVRKLPTGTARIKRLKRHRKSRLDMLKLIYAEERKVTHLRYIIRWVNGAVEVTTFARNRVLYVFEQQILEALVTLNGSARPWTVIEAHGHVGKGTKHTALKWTEQHRDVVARFGRTVQIRHFGRVNNLAELQRRARRAYAANLRIKYTATVTVPGVPFIRRGDGIELRLPSEGYSGDDAMVYTTRVVHHVTADSYTTEMDVNRVDPYERDRKRVEKAVRAGKRAKRKAHHHG
jgi:hypothetical protein